MRIAAKEQRLVMGFYGVSLFLLMSTVMEIVPMNLFFILTKIKYIYILVMLAIYFRDGVVIFSRRLCIAVGLLLLHTIIYGVFITNPQVAETAKIHFEQLLVIYAIVIVTCCYIYKRDCYLEFLEATFAALSALILISAATHPGDFVNPVYYVNIFSDLGRFRAQFGLSDINYCGNYCVYSIISSIFLQNEWKERGKKVSQWMIRYLWFLRITAMLMLLSTASRSAILSFILFLSVWWMLKNSDMLYKNRKKILIVLGVTASCILIVGTSTGILSELWISSNREGNFSINYPFFQQYGDYLHGMGYSENADFLNKKYGYATTAMDIYYLYIFFASGIIGSSIILSQMVYVFFCLVKYKEAEGRNIILSLFCMMLFYAVWQVNYMNYRYYTGVFHMVVIFLCLMRAGKNSDDLTLVLKWR